MADVENNNNVSEWRVSFVVVAVATNYRVIGNGAAVGWCKHVCMLFHIKSYLSVCGHPVLLSSLDILIIRGDRGGGWPR